MKNAKRIFVLSNFNIDFVTLVLIDCVKRFVDFFFLRNWIFCVERKCGESLRI